MFVIAMFTLRAAVLPLESAPLVSIHTARPLVEFTAGAIGAGRRSAAAAPTKLTAPTDTVAAPPVLSDSLLLRWHLALVHLSDTLRVHPDLQALPGLAPLVNGVDCHAWAGPTRSDTLAVQQHAGLATFPGAQVAAVIAATAALTGAVRTGGMTPATWVATTSAIEQEECASRAFYETFAKTGHWPVDPTSTLGKNLTYFWLWRDDDPAKPKKYDQHRSARLGRIRAKGLTALSARSLRSPSGNADADEIWGTRMEEWPDVKGRLMDATGQEIPIP